MYGQIYCDLAKRNICEHQLRKRMETYVKLNVTGISQNFGADMNSGVSGELEYLD